MTDLIRRRDRETGRLTSTSLGQVSFTWQRDLEEGTRVLVSREVVEHNAPDGRMRRMEMLFRFRLYRPEIQPVFQDFHNALNPRFRIIEILKESLRICSRKDISIEELIAVVGLGTDILNYFPHQLSGGQKQRIVIARALIPEPQLLLLDEPVSSLDITVAVQIIKLLKNLRKKENLTFLLVSHNLPIIRLLANRIAIMKNGHILEEKPTEDLFETPEHPYTRALVNQALISCQSYQ